MGWSADSPAGDLFLSRWAQASDCRLPRQENPRSLSRLQCVLSQCPSTASWKSASEQQGQSFEGSLAERGTAFSASPRFGPKDPAHKSSRTAWPNTEKKEESGSLGAGEGLTWATASAPHRPGRRSVWVLVRSHTPGHALPSSLGQASGSPETLYKPHSLDPRSSGCGSGPRDTPVGGPEPAGREGCEAGGWGPPCFSFPTVGDWPSSQSIQLRVGRDSWETPAVPHGQTVRIADTVGVWSLPRRPLCGSARSTTHTCTGRQSQHPEPAFRGHEALRDDVMSEEELRSSCTLQNPAAEVHADRV